MSRLNRSYSPPSTITWISFDSVINYLAPVLLRQKYHDLQHFICESDRLSFYLAKIISPDATISLTTFNHTLSSLQLRLSLLSTNNSSSSRILSKQLVHPTSLSHHIALNNIAPNCNTVSNSITRNGNIVSTIIAPNGNTVWHSIVPIDKIVYHNIVDKYNLLLSKHISFSFTSASIRYVNRVDCTSYSNLYFDVHRWII